MESLVPRIMSWLGTVPRIPGTLTRLSGEMQVVYALSMAA